MKNTIKILSIAGTALLALSINANAEEGDKKGKQRKLPPHVVEKFDADNDGKLNESERETARAAMKERRDKIVKEFDTDGSGKLDTEEERKAARAAMKERQGEDGPHGKGDKDKKRKGGKGKGGKGAPGGKGGKGGQK